ncbi:MAG: hypothetical protein QW265_05490 [Candidatus Bathyarchaeia archaeon]
MEKKPGKSYVYITIVFSLIILIYSIWLLQSSFTSYLEGRFENFYYGLIAGSIGIALAVISLVQIRKKLEFFYTMSKTITTILCEKCGFKIIREFNAGDYIHKQIGKCQRCDGEMYISAIFAEERKKRIV